MKSFKTSQEAEIGPAVASIFERSDDSVEQRLESFPKYVRRQQLKRFLALYELYKVILPVKGSIIECGVFRGFGYMSWLKLGAILEPENLTRRVYGFDTFEGFPALSEPDTTSVAAPSIGDLRSQSYEELLALTELHDRDRFLGHIPKGTLIRGDIAETAPRFMTENPHLVVSLLFLDADLYAPTKAAIETFVPRMPRGAVIAFDELDNPQWPGETVAAIDALGLGKLRLRRLEWDPYISYAEVE